MTARRADCMRSQRSSRKHSRPDPRSRRNARLPTRRSITPTSTPSARPLETSCHATRHIGIPDFPPPPPVVSVDGHDPSDLPDRRRGRLDAPRVRAGLVGAGRAVLARSARRHARAGRAGCSPTGRSADGARRGARRRHGRALGRGPAAGREARRRRAGAHRGRRRQGRPAGAGRLRLGPRADAAHAARRLPRPVRHHRAGAGGLPRPVPRRPGLPLHLRRRHPAGHAERLPRPDRDGARRRPRRRRRRPVARAARARRPDLAGHPGQLPHRAAARAAGRAVAGPRPRCAADGGAAPVAARARPPLPAGTAPAHPAGPVRHLLRLRPAARAGRAGGRPVRRAGLRRLDGGRRHAPARGRDRPSCRAARGRPAHLVRGRRGRRRRPAGSPAPGSRTAPSSPPTSWSRRSTPTCSTGT